MLSNKVIDPQMLGGKVRVVSRRLSQDGIADGFHIRGVEQMVNWLDLSP